MTGAEVAVLAAAAPEVIGAGTAAAAAPTITSMALGEMGAGMLGAGMGGGTASLFGAAGAPALASTLQATAPVIPSLAATAPAVVPGMGGGTASLFGAGIPPGMGSPPGIPWASMLKGMGQASQAMGQQQPPKPVPVERPPQTAQPMSNAEVLRKMAELRQLPGRSNFAGLLGNFQ